MKRLVFASIVAVLAVGVSSAATSGTASGAAAPASASAKLVAKAEQMAMSMLPQEKFDKAVGFFGPVAKKYMPVMQDFQKEYKAAKEKIPVIEKYLPQAEAAYADAQAMQVPAKYEQEKQGYLKMVNRFLSVVKMSLAVYGASK